MIKIKLFILLFLLSFNTVSYSQPVTFTINLHHKAQTIAHIGASGAWFSEGIGKYWPDSIKEQMARLLFGKGFDRLGRPSGIGLSTWRFNIGGGTAEQGDSSGIINPVKRVESFLAPDGTYHWGRQQGCVWFVKKAAFYGVKDLIAFSNTPPVQFTKNGLGYKTEKDYTANLKDNSYVGYATFLGSVIQHFDREGLHFNYISPVNEPQWGWAGTFGKMDQEGSPWHNADIYRITKCLDSVISAKKLSVKIIVPEAGILTALYEGNGPASKQIQTFYNKTSKYYIGNLKKVQPVIEGHSYFTDLGDTAIIKTRTLLKDTAAKYQVPFWQSEYCMLGNGYKEGMKGKISAMDCALFLAKLIYHDMVIANAAAWDFWNAWEPGNAEMDTRYYLIALKNNPENTTGNFTVTKNLWALGHYSRFIRPGMQRIIVQRSDSLTAIGAAQNIMLATFAGHKAVVIVTINYTTTPKKISLNLPGIKVKSSMQLYVTTANARENMAPYKLPSLNNITLQPRSINTIVLQR